MLAVGPGVDQQRPAVGDLAMQTRQDFFAAGTAVQAQAGGLVTVTVRAKGYESVSRTFDTKGEARIWAAELEAEMKGHRYKDPPL